MASLKLLSSALVLKTGASCHVSVFCFSLYMSIERVRATKFAGSLFVYLICDVGVTYTIPVCYFTMSYLQYAVYDHYLLQNSTTRLITISSASNSHIAQPNVRKGR